MTKLNCRTCVHCNLNNIDCNVYGNNPSIAVTNCALDGFRNYKKKLPTGTWIVLNENDEECQLSEDVVREAIVQFVDKYFPHLHGVPYMIK